MEDCVVKIGSNGRITKYVEKCNKMLGKAGKVKLKGVKKAIPKAISVAEILKRKNFELALEQKTKIKYITIADDADEDQEDGFIGTSKTKKVSMIEITLVKTNQPKTEEAQTRDETLIKKRDPTIKYEIL